jgi:hypothetical protein
MIPSASVPPLHEGWPKPLWLVPFCQSRIMLSLCSGVGPAHLVAHRARSREEDLLSGDGVLRGWLGSRFPLRILPGGVFIGAFGDCKQYCGAEHARMRLPVILGSQ